MSNLWDKNSYYDNFKLFSITHILSMVIIIGIILLIYFFKENIKNNDKMDIYLRSIIAVIMMFGEWSFYYWALVHGVFDIRGSLPLTLSGMNVYLVFILLFNKSYFLYEILFFMVSLGSVQAIITPDIGYTFPHFRYIQFFSTHGCVLISIFYMTFIYEFKPKPISIIKAYVALILYAILVWIFNIYVGGNYLYLAHKPENVSLLNYFGPWPWYVVTMAMGILPYFLLVYLLFYSVILFKSKINNL